MNDLYLDVLSPRTHLWEQWLPLYFFLQELSSGVKLRNWQEKICPENASGVSICLKFNFGQCFSDWFRKEEFTAEQSQNACCEMWVKDLVPNFPSRISDCVITSLSPWQALSKQVGEYPHSSIARGRNKFRLQDNSNAPPNNLEANTEHIVVAFVWKVS